MNPKELFDSLVTNAFDFLDRSMEEFNAHPKYSVIHFYAAVELFLKARLLQEHWSLVVSKRQEPEWEKFVKGDFISVTMDEAAEKLEKVVRSGLTGREIRVFRGLARHRNKMVHFFHEADSTKAAEKLLQEIAQEQCVAWHLLQKLLTERWGDAFNKHQVRIHQLGEKMRQHHEYLKVVFEEIKSTIEAEKTRGVLFTQCPSCGFDAQQVDDEVGHLIEGKCLVCKYRGISLGIECPDCGEEAKLVDEGFGICEECGHKFEPKEIAALLTRDIQGSKRYFETGLPAHCHQCDGYKTVVPYGGKYLCTCCFAVYEDDDLGQCEWCGETCTGDLEDSFWQGCVFCEGKAGWERNKDD